MGDIAAEIRRFRQSPPAPRRERPASPKRFWWQDPAGLSSKQLTQVPQPEQQSQIPARSSLIRLKPPRPSDPRHVSLRASGTLARSSADAKPSSGALEGLTEQTTSLTGHSSKSGPVQSSSPPSPAPIASPADPSGQGKAAQNLIAKPWQDPVLAPTPSVANARAVGNSLQWQDANKSVQEGFSPSMKLQHDHGGSPDFSATHMGNASQEKTAIAQTQQGQPSGLLQQGQEGIPTTHPGLQRPKMGKKQAALERLAGQHPQLFRALQAMQLDASGRISSQSVAQVQHAAEGEARATPALASERPRGKVNDEQSPTSTQTPPGVPDLAAANSNHSQAPEPVPDNAVGVHALQPAEKPLGHQLHPVAAAAQAHFAPTQAAASKAPVSVSQNATGSSSASAQGLKPSPVPVTATVPGGSSGAPTRKALPSAAVHDATAIASAEPALAASGLLSSDRPQQKLNMADLMQKAASEPMHQLATQLQHTEVTLAAQPMGTRLPDMQIPQEAALASPAASAAASDSSEDFGIPPEPTRLPPLPALEPGVIQFTQQHPGASSRAQSPVQRHQRGLFSRKSASIHHSNQNIGHGNSRSGQGSDVEGPDHLEDAAESLEDDMELQDPGQLVNIRDSTPPKLRWSSSSASSSGASMLQEPLRSAQRGSHRAHAGSKPPSAPASPQPAPKRSLGHGNGHIRAQSSSLDRSVASFTSAMGRSGLQAVSRSPVGRKTSLKEGAARATDATDAAAQQEQQHSRQRGRRHSSSSSDSSANQQPADALDEQHYPSVAAPAVAQNELRHDMTPPFTSQLPPDQSGRHVLPSQMAVKHADDWAPNTASAVLQPQDSQQVNQPSIVSHTAAAAPISSANQPYTGALPPPQKVASPEQQATKESQGQPAQRDSGLTRAPERFADVDAEAASSDIPSAAQAPAANPYASIDSPPRLALRAHDHADQALRLSNTSRSHQDEADQLTAPRVMQHPPGPEQLGKIDSPAPEAHLGPTGRSNVRNKEIEGYEAEFTKPALPLQKGGLQESQQHLRRHEQHAGSMESRSSWKPQSQGGAIVQEGQGGKHPEAEEFEGPVHPEKMASSLAVPNPTERSWQQEALPKGKMDRADQPPEDLPHAGRNLPVPTRRSQFENAKAGSMLRTKAHESQGNSTPFSDAASKNSSRGSSNAGEACAMSPATQEAMRASRKPERQPLREISTHHNNQHGMVWPQQDSVATTSPADHNRRAKPIQAMNLEELADYLGPSSPAMRELHAQQKLREAQEALRKAGGGDATGEQPLLKQFLAQSDQLRTAVLQAAIDQQRALLQAQNTPAKPPTPKADPTTARPAAPANLPAGMGGSQPAQATPGVIVSDTAEGADAPAYVPSRMPLVDSSQPALKLETTPARQSQEGLHSNTILRAARQMTNQLEATMRSFLSEVQGTGVLNSRPFNLDNQPLIQYVPETPYTLPMARQEQFTPAVSHQHQSHLLQQMAFASQPEIPPSLFTLPYGAQLADAGQAQAATSFANPIQPSGFNALPQQHPSQQPVAQWPGLPWSHNALGSENAPSLPLAYGYPPPSNIAQQYPIAPLSMSGVRPQALPGLLGLSSYPALPRFPSMQQLQMPAYAASSRALDALPWQPSSQVVPTASQHRALHPAAAMLEAPLFMQPPVRSASGQQSFSAALQPAMSQQAGPSMSPKAAAAASSQQAALQPGVSQSSLPFSNNQALQPTMSWNDRHSRDGQTLPVQPQASFLHPSFVNQAVLSQNGGHENRPGAHQGSAMLPGLDTAVWSAEGPASQTARSGGRAYGAPQLPGTHAQDSSHAGGLDLSSLPSGPPLHVAGTEEALRAAEFSNDGSRLPPEPPATYPRLQPPRQEPHLGQQAMHRGDESRQLRLPPPSDVNGDPGHPWAASGDDRGRSLPWGPVVPEAGGSSNRGYQRDEPSREQDVDHAGRHRAAWNQNERPFASSRMPEGMHIHQRARQEELRGLYMPMHEHVDDARRHSVPHGYRGQQSSGWQVHGHRDMEMPNRAPEMDWTGISGYAGPRHQDWIQDDSQWDHQDQQLNQDVRRGGERQAVRHRQPREHYQGQPPPLPMRAQFSRASVDEWADAERTQAAASHHMLPHRLPFRRSEQHAFDDGGYPRNLRGYQQADTSTRHDRVAKYFDVPEQREMSILPRRDMTRRHQDEEGHDISSRYPDQPYAERSTHRRDSGWSPY
ncbi:hypothetical protein WJX74_000889 [Apatococcus lobatus]|uniref:Uncharacterized protein n=1 Tax=Apatococcus lobatus TaxID=904363 RepID=A0AAW1RVZ9_9CHLO